MSRMLKGRLRIQERICERHEQGGGGATWVVDDSGGADFASIQAAGDAASERAMVEIRAMA